MYYFTSTKALAEGHVGKCEAVSEISLVEEEFSQNEIHYYLLQILFRLRQLAGLMQHIRALRQCLSDNNPHSIHRFQLTTSQFHDAGYRTKDQQ